jgi:hypothetical protein
VLMKNLTSLVQKYSHFQHKVTLNNSQEGFGAQGCLEKVCELCNVLESTFIFLFFF